jgi:ATP adenylyltransferase
MDRLWAPWRMAYIAAPPADECFLCRAWKSRSPGKHYILKKGRTAFVVMNIYPYSNGHLMVASAQHVGHPDDLPAAARAEMAETVTACLKVLDKAMKPKGYNIGVNIGQCAGAGLADHLHVHIVPRWPGDTNYMPVLSDVKVISEHIDDTYRKLKRYFK